LTTDERVVGALRDGESGPWSFTSNAAAARVRVPHLDGTLLATPDVLAEHARDLGNLVVRAPAAVLRPGSVRDIEQMIQFCGSHGIRVAARGEKHTTYGQGLVPHGLAIDMRTLNRIHHVDHTVADVDAGVLWRDLVERAGAVGARFAALTGYLKLTVGGTLSVGGISPAYKLGAQVDLVRELQIVTGRGQALWCSRDSEPELFNAALAGLGQVGVITRVRLHMTRMPAAVRLHLLDYPAARANDAFAAMKVLCDNGQADELYCMVLPPQDENGPVYRLFVTEFDDRAEDLFDRVPTPVEQQHLDLPYVDYAMSNDVMIDAIRGDGAWDRLRKPWFDVFVPEEHVAEYMTSVVNRMSIADFSPGTGFVLVFPHNADAFRRPRLRVPGGTQRVYLCDVLGTDALDHGDPDTYPERSLDRNEKWISEAREVGGYVYPIGSARWTPREWQEHYGRTWGEVQVAKLRWDPAGVLTPGPGIDFVGVPARR
jgi:cytokinin dehydrogenase